MTEGQVEQEDHPGRRGNRTAILLAQLAAAELLASLAIRRVRRCEGRDCQMLFLSASPRRRWCSPTVCGKRARVARYYQRHKDSTTGHSGRLAGAGG